MVKKAPPSLMLSYTAHILKIRKTSRFVTFRNSNTCFKAEQKYAGQDFFQTIEEDNNK